MVLDAAAADCEIVVPIFAPTAFASAIDPFAPATTADATEDESTPPALTSVGASE